MRINKSIFIALFLMWGLPALAQNESLLATWEPQLKGMVRFFEYGLNLLGNDSVPAADKEVIINESYLRIFKDAEVQIEDDLLENRRETTNKNVQAYLRDVDFFFKNVRFTYHIQDIRLELTEKDKPYFRIETRRTLKGIGIEGETIANNQQRFFEISLDKENRDLKIVSIYTKTIGQEEELCQWWAGLSLPWKKWFANNIPLPNQTGMLADILVADPNANIGDRYKIGAETIELQVAWIGPSLLHLVNRDSLDLSQTPMTDLEPLTRFNRLIWLNLQGLPISNLKGVRNATQLQYLNIANTQVKSLEPLRFCEKLRVLQAKGAQIANAGQLKHLIGLEEAYLTANPLTQLEGIQMAGHLKVLHFDSTLVTQIEPLAGLPNLRQIHAGHCNIQDISPLASCAGLERINMENTQVKDLSPLAQLLDLKYIFCDDTPLSPAAIQNFQFLRPDVVLMFGTEEISRWWNALPPIWKEHIAAKVQKGAFRNKKEYLHALVRIDSLSLPSRMLSDIAPLRFLSRLEYLDLSGNPIEDFGPLAGLSKLKVLKMNQTGLKHLGFVGSMNQLREIYINQNQLKSIGPLAAIPGLLRIEAEGNPLDSIGAIAHLAANPSWELLWHSSTLEQFWQGLDSSWKAVFKKQLPALPARNALHKLETLKEIQLQGTGISDLTPLMRLPLLEKLNLKGLGISDLSPIRQIHTLKELDVSENPISSLQDLRRCGALFRLNASGTLIETPGELLYFLNLSYLNLSSTPLAQLDGFEALTQLKHLDVSATHIRHLKPLHGLNQLKVLRVFNTRAKEREAQKLKESLPECEVVFY